MVKRKRKNQFGLRGLRTFTLFMVILVVLALTAGCGGGANVSNESANVADTEPAEEPVEEPAEEPTEEPAEEPAEEPTEEPMEEPAEEPTEEPMEEPAEEPTEEPMEEPATGEGPLYGGTLVVSRWPDLLSCNPSSSFGTDITVSEIMGNIFDPLIRPNAAGEMQPQLAESWEVSDDGLTITWNLRDDVFWHDGEPFTSEDVKFTFEGAISTDHPRGNQVYDALERVETPDDYTAIFHMAEPRAAAIFAAHGSEGLIIPEHIYASEDLAEGPHATCEELPIGTGPFRAVEYIPADRFVMERNPDWWGREGDYWGEGQPYLDRVIFTFIADVTARVNCLESGECDYVGMQQLPNNEVERFQQMEGRDVQLACTTQALGIQNLYAFNLRMTDAPWSDVRVRQAISYAINRDVINDRVYFGTGTPTTTFAPPGTAWYTDTVVEYEQDLDRANELLDEAGYPRGDDGTRFEVTVTHDTRPTHTDLANYLQQALEEVGIAVSIETLDFSAWVEKVHMEQDFEMMVSILGVGDPAVGASRLFRSDNAAPAPFNNSSGYMDDEMDALWADFATTFDFEERQAIMSEIQAKITTDLPYIYVMSTNYPLGINTAEFAGFPTDCGRGDDLLRTIWWKEGSPEPAS